MVKEIKQDVLKKALLTAYKDELSFMHEVCGIHDTRYDQYFLQEAKQAENWATVSFLSCFVHAVHFKTQDSERFLCAPGLVN